MLTMNKTLRTEIQKFRPRCPEPGRKNGFSLGCKLRSVLEFVIKQTEFILYFNFCSPSPSNPPFKTFEKT